MSDLRFAFRHLSRARGFTAVAVFTLALGIGANTAIFSVVHGALLQPLRYSDPDALVRLAASRPQKKALDMTVSYPTSRDWREQGTSFVHTAAYAERGLNLAGDRPERVRAVTADADLFPLLGVRPAMGRAFSEQEAREGAKAVVVSHELWKGRYASDARLVGATIHLDDVPWTVVGVMPAGFQFPPQASRRVDLWLPLAPNDDRGASFLRVVARLKADVTPAAAQARMSAVVARLPEGKRGQEIRLIPLHEDVVGAARQTLLLFSGAVALVLLIACANVANLSLAHAASRSRETTIRIALGATRGALFRRSITESLLLAVGGGAAGLVLAYAGTAALLAAIPPNTLPVSRLEGIGVNAPVLAFTLALSLVAGIAFGVGPALRVATSDLGARLKEAGRPGTSGPAAGRLRRTLVVAEIALSSTLLLGAGLLLKSYYVLQQEPLGFDPDDVVTLQLDLPRAKYRGAQDHRMFFDGLLEQLATIPGAGTAGLVNTLPLSGGTSTSGYRVLDGTGGEELGSGSVASRVVTPGYFRAMGIPLREGRGFDARDTNTGRNVAIVNETFARTLWPGTRAVGRILELGGERTRCEVIGVSGDVRDRSLERHAQGEVYVPFAQSPRAEMAVVVKASGDPAQLMARLRDAVTRLDRSQPVLDLRTLGQVVAASVAPRRFNMLLLASFAVMALSLASAGVYGVVSSAAAQRTRELGVRVALGAERHDLMAAVFRPGLSLALIGAGLGVAAGSMGARVLANQLYGVTRFDPSILGATMAVLLGAAALACWMPARRAAGVDPVVALRNE
jgi:putative ABC transport system permease protein